MSRDGGIFSVRRRDDRTTIAPLLSMPPRHRPTDRGVLLLLSLWYTHRPAPALIRSKLRTTLAAGSAASTAAQSAAVATGIADLRTRNVCEFVF